jgi:hypothetical protein
MKRSGGVTTSAIACFAGSLLALILGAAVIVLPVTSPPRGMQSPSAPTGAMLAFPAALFLLCSAWAFASGVGLLRLRQWARVSVQVFSVFAGVGSVVAALIISLTPFPETPNMTPVNLTAVRHGLAGFYLLTGAAAGGWLCYFSRPSVKVQFLSAQKPERRPTSIMSIAALFFLDAMACVAAALTSGPFALLGFVLTGWPARLGFVSLAGVQLWLTAGLLQAWSATRKIAITFCCFTILNSVSYVAMPGYSARITSHWPAANPATTSQYTVVFFASALFAVLINAAAIWFLAGNRERLGTTRNVL